MQKANEVPDKRFTPISAINQIHAKFDRLTTGPYTPQLTRYFPSIYPIPSTKSLFLQLPVEIRQRIYQFTDLVRDCPISLNSALFEFACQEEEDASQNSDDSSQSSKDEYFETIIRRCRCPALNYYIDEMEDEISDMVVPHFDECHPISIALLLVSRHVYHEAFPVLYSKNSFEVCVTKATLTRLQDLNQQALSIMSSLLIEVWVSKDTISGHLAQNSQEQENQSSAGLSLETHRDEALLHRFTDFLASNLGSSLSSMSIIIHGLDDTSLLPAIKGCFMKMPATLEASMRVFGTAFADVQTKEYVKATVRSLTTKHIEHTSFHQFSRLPHELQLKIINHAAIASTDRSFVARTSNSHRGEVYSGSLLWTYNLYAKQRYGSNSKGHLVQAGCCGNCQPTVSPEYYRSLDVQQRHALGCMCPQRRIPFAYDHSPDDYMDVVLSSSWSTTCTCQSVPTSLFLVNRDFAHAAQKEFYQNTRFILTTFSRDGDSDDGFYSDLWSDCRNLSFFQDCVPQQYLPSIRHIQIRVCLKDDELSLMSETISAHRAWPNMPPVPNLFTTFFRYLMTHLDFCNLTLAVHVANRWTESGFDVEDDHINAPNYPNTLSYAAMQYSHALSIERLAATMGVAIRFASYVEGYSQPPRLKDLQIYTTSPAGKESTKMRLEMEAKCEQSVMGIEGKTNNSERKLSFAPNLQSMPGYEKHQAHLFCMPGLCISTVKDWHDHYETRYWWWTASSLDE